MIARMHRVLVVIALAFVFATACGGAAVSPEPRAPSAPAPVTTGAAAHTEALPEPVAAAVQGGFPAPSSALAHTRELAMFDDQAAPLRALATRTDERLAALGAQRKAALTALAALFDAVPLDEAALHAKLAEIAALEADTVRVQIDARVETRRILRPEQLVKLRALRSATTL